MGYEVFQGKDDRWYWHLKADNGEVVAQSEGYATKAGAEDGVELVQKINANPEESSEHE